ncbi:MAG: VWA domain-containing protein [Bacteroidales bacterium]|nr:VWA domain-containing protein [Bacteroidales bacterium]
MLNIAQGEYLLLLILIPFFFLLYAGYLRMKRRRMAKMGDPDTVSQLMPDVSNGRGWLKISLFAVAFFFFVIGLSRPQLGARLKEKETKGVEIMIALDVSNSMLAEDFTPNRLERAKLAISRLVDRLSGDRIGLVIFAGESFIQLPITTDYVSAKVFLNNISTTSIPVQGTAIADALMTTARSFSSQSENSRAIILITDGEDHEGDVLDAARAIGDSGIRIYCIGIGSPEGKPIPMNGTLMKDENGDIVVTRLDESMLRKIAEAGNGSYVRAGATEFGLNPIIDSIKQIDAQNFKSVVFEDFDEQYMYFFAIALFFLIVDLFIGERRTGKNLFNRQ